MRHIRPIVVVILLVSTLFPVMAQKQISDDDRIRINQRMRELKHNFLVNTLNLTKEQQREFFPIYDRMDDEMNALNTQNREIENSIMQNDSPTDADYSTAARTLFEQKGKESAIELEYYPLFEKILSPKQLFLLKGAEREFLSKIVRQHGRRAKVGVDVSPGRVGPKDK